MLMKLDPFSDIKRDLDYIFNYSPTSFTPPVEWKETDTHYHLAFQLPGMKVEDIDVEVGGDFVKVSGERVRKDATRSEFYYGSFSRKVTFEDRINTSDVKADYLNGILEVTLAKSDTGGTVKVRVTQSYIRLIVARSRSLGGGCDRLDWNNFTLSVDPEFEEEEE